jgi:hypothetical protein
LHALPGCEVTHAAFAVFVHVVQPLTVSWKPALQA